MYSWRNFGTTKISVYTGRVLFSIRPLCVEDLEKVERRVGNYNAPNLSLAWTKQHSFLPV